MSTNKVSLKPQYSSIVPSKIRTEIGTVIRMTWLNFALEDSYKCMFDHVEIYDSETQNNITSMGR